MKEDTILENNTQMNEETILESNSQMNESTMFEEDTASQENMEAGKKQSNGKTWTTVTLGGVSGILLGAGLLYAQKAYGSTPEPPVEPGGSEEPPFQTTPGTEEEPADSTPQESHNQGNEVHHHTHVHTSSPTPHGVAAVGDDMSFAEAFAEARAEVGPGGVFVWHGGVYSTFYAEEWNAMTPAEQQAFTGQVGVAVPVARIDTPPTETNPEPWGPHPMPHAPQSEGTDELVEVEVDDQTREGFDLGEDVHVVGFLKDGDDHLIAAYDHNNDGEVDLAIVDVDYDKKISDPDIIVDMEGNAETVGEFVARTEMENNDVSGNAVDYTSDEPVEENDTNDDPSLHYTSNEYDPASDTIDNMDNVVVDL